MGAHLSTTAGHLRTRSVLAKSRIFKLLWERPLRYLVRRAAIARLRALDSDALRDIGLVRSEIEAAAYGLIAVPHRVR
jgi:uncharacterized protein YjiS (DUF1127 family)